MQGMTIFINCLPPPVSAIAQLPPLLLVSKGREQMLPLGSNFLSEKVAAVQQPGDKKEVGCKGILDFAAGLESETDVKQRDSVSHTA